MKILSVILLIIGLLFLLFSLVSCCNSCCASDKFEDLFSSKRDSFQVAEVKDAYASLKTSNDALSANLSMNRATSTLSFFLLSSSAVLFAVADNRDKKNYKTP